MAPRRLGHRPELDGLRGLALAIVTVHHLGALLWQGHPWWFVPGGQVGLDLFFALSGFLITALLLGELQRTGSIRARRFLWRRVLRLTPALVVLMAGLLVASVVTDRYPAREVVTSAGWVLGFATNLNVEQVVIEVGHTWSLGVEAHFYLLWGLVAAAVATRSRRPYPVLAVVAGAGVTAVAVGRAAAFASGTPPFDLYVGSQYRLDAPLLGALAGVAWAAGWLDRVPARAARWASAAALACLLVAAVEIRPLDPVLYQGLFTGLAACGAVLVIGALRGGPGALHRALTLRPLVALGVASYSTYLWHLPVIMFIERNTTDWPMALRLTVTVVVIVAAGALSYRLVERPLLRRRVRATA